MTVRPRTSAKAQARVAAAVGSDAALWMRRETFAPSTVAMGCSADIRVVYAELERRGWRLRKLNHVRTVLDMAPCRKCGESFTIAAGQRERVCPACAAEVPLDPAVALCRAEFAAWQARQARREEAA